MKTYTKEELDEILVLHAKWVRGEEGGARADLRQADLRQADLWKADLRQADLRQADLRQADLRKADLRQADLWKADLSEANDVPRHVLDYFAQDLLYVLLNSTEAEVRGLLQAVQHGKIDGTQYNGDCCCLIGTLAKAHVGKVEDVEDVDTDTFVTSCIPYYEKGLHNPGEQLFYQIKKGDTPTDNQFAKLAEEVIALHLAKLESKQAPTEVQP